MSARDASPRTPAAASHVAADLRLDRGIGRLLRIGVLVAAAVTLAGGVLLLATRGMRPADLAALPGPTPPPSSLAAVLRGALALDPAAVTQLGVVLLILTPVSRVVLTLVAFVRRRDLPYTTMAALVLALLLWGMLFGA